MLFDTHTHYDDEQFDNDREARMESLPKKGVSLAVAVGVDLETSRTSIEYAERYDFFYTAVGIHPHQAGSLKEGDLDEIRKLTDHPKVVAIGEIGLDYHYDFSPREVQKDCFCRQMELARELSMPVIIHEREAHADCLAIVKDIRVQKGVYHCYSGSLEMAKELVKFGYFISFTGVITFANARKFEEIIRWLPMDRIMIETDCPYLSPVPFRGRRNDSSLVRYVAEKIAEIRGMSFEDVAKATLQNGRQFFNIGE